MWFISFLLLQQTPFPNDMNGIILMKKKAYRLYLKMEYRNARLHYLTDLNNFKQSALPYAHSKSRFAVVKGE